MSQKRAEPKDLVDRLTETAVECRELIRDMHAAEKDLRAVIKEARAIRDELKTVIEDTVKMNVDEVVSREIDKLGEHTQQAMAATSRKILSEFDKLSEPLMQSFGDIGNAQKNLSDQLMSAFAQFEENRRNLQLLEVKIGEALNERIDGRVQEILAEHGFASRPGAPEGHREPP
jgi:hypothetical protein